MAIQEFDARTVRLLDINMVCRFINKIINEVRKGDIGDKCARTCLYGSQLMMSAIEKRDMQTKIAELEAAVLKLETDTGRRNGRRY